MQVAGFMCGNKLSAASATQQSPGQGRKAAEALGLERREESPEGAEQLLCRPFRAGCSPIHFLGLAPQAPLFRAFSAIPTENYAALGGMPGFAKAMPGKPVVPAKSKLSFY
jgi:hypothetical protein